MLHYALEVKFSIDKRGDSVMQCDTPLVDNATLCVGGLKSSIVKEGTVCQSPTRNAQIFL